jgi:stearoyl-CoA desaturase (delta-9 desaturase)
MTIKSNSEGLGPSRKKGFLKKNHFIRSIVRWVDGYTEPTSEELKRHGGVDLLRITPFVLLHLGCLGVIWVGFSWTAVGVAAGLYLIRMFAITGIYHRYFSHRTYSTSRFFQFLFAVLGSASVQRGPLWWASHHRHHHKYSDKPEDVHSPLRQGFWYSHMGWFTTLKNFPTKKELVGDWARFPELRFLDRYSLLVPLILGVGLFVTGELLAAYLPATGTTGLQLFVWGFCISTVVLFHATATINSLDHMIGRRRYNTTDDSRNNWFLALITLGEGWHNNHHHYPIAARQGFYWWELDLTYLGLVLLSWLGVIRDLRPVPEKVLTSNLVSQSVSSVGRSKGKGA